VPNGFRKYKFLILSLVKNGGIFSSISSFFYLAKDQKFAFYETIGGVGYKPCFQYFVFKKPK